jgi:hypothetical protein
VFCAWQGGGKASEVPVVFVTNSRAVVEILMMICIQLCMVHIEKWTYTLAREIENQAFLTHAENNFLWKCFSKLKFLLDRPFVQVVKF